MKRKPNKRKEEKMPMSEKEMNDALKALRLSGMRESLEARALQAKRGEMDFMDAFSALVQDELDRRKTRTTQRRFKLSGLKERKTLEEFDWQFNPKLPKKTCFDLATLGFIQKGENALLIGTPGTGKSHIAKAIANGALENSYKVAYREANKLFEQLFEAKQLGEHKKTHRYFTNIDLLVIDDLFLKKKLPQNATDEFQEIIFNRYEMKKSTLITSNRAVDDWGEALGDQAVAVAVTDRLLHYGNLLKFQGPSYRLKEASSRLAKSAKKA